MEKKTYNGWTNYETWNWNLWYGDSSFSNEELKPFVGKPYELGKYLEDWTEEMAEEHGILTDKHFFSDVVQASIKEVNFYEIAEHMLSDYEPEEAE